MRKTALALAGFLFLNSAHAAQNRDTVYTGFKTLELPALSKAFGPDACFYDTYSVRGSAETLDYVDVSCDGALDFFLRLRNNAGRRELYQSVLIMDDRKALIEREYTLKYAAALNVMQRLAAMNGKRFPDIVLESRDPDAVKLQKEFGVVIAEKRR